MVDTSTNASRKNIMMHTLNDLEWVVEGTYYLSKWAFDDDDFATEFEKCLQEINEFIKEQRDGKHPNASKDQLPVARAMKKNMEKIRTLLFEIVETQRPRKFAEKVARSRLHCHKLKVFMTVHKGLIIQSRNPSKKAQVTEEF